jgi:flavin reductase (DIM6/NTAB) family NADH-FMN oxidoreductase RutF
MKIKIGPEPYLYPIPMVLVGALVTGRANFETIGDTGLMGLNPPLVYVSSHKDHFTNMGILESNVFSINVANMDLLARLDHCGIVSGKDHDKSALFQVFYGTTGAPMIDECPVNLECKVIKEFSIQHRQVFIANVIQTYVSEQFVSEQNGKRTISGLDKLQPILYALDNRYYSIGKAIGTGYKEGESIQTKKIA